MQKLTSMPVRSTTPTTMQASKIQPRVFVFDLFDAYEPTLKAAKEAAQKFVDDVIANPWHGGYILTLMGPSGTGKTMLTKCVFAALMANGHGHCDAIPERLTCGRLDKLTSRYFSWRKVSTKLKEGQWDIVDAMIEPRLICLDDIGADHDPNRFAAGKLDEVLRSRANTWTLLTLNLPLAEIAAKMDTRIASFIIRDENRHVEVKAVDFALRKLKLNTPLKGN